MFKASAFKTAAVIALVCTALACDARLTFAAEDLATAKRIGRTDAPKTLTLFTSDGGPWTNVPEVAAVFTKIYADFIAKRPDWKIIPQIQVANTTQVHARLLEQAKAGRAPDCASIDSFMAPQFIEAGVLADLTPYFSAEQVADLFPYAREGGKDKDGKIRAWWWNTDLRVLYRNTDLIPEAPQTWDEMKAAAMAAKEKGFEGIVFNGGRFEGTTFDWLSNFWVQGGALVDEGGAPIFARGENREKMLRALWYYKDLVESGAAPRRVSTIVNYDELAVAAAANAAASFVGGSWQWDQLRRSLPAEHFRKWAVSALPAPTAGKHVTGVGGWTFASFSRDPEKTKLCAEIVKEVYAGYGSVAQDVLPTARSLYETLEPLATPTNKIFAEMLVDGHARPGAFIYPEISNQIQIMLSAILAGKTEPEAALDAADKAVQEVYARMKKTAQARPAVKHPRISQVRPAV